MKHVTNYKREGGKTFKDNSLPARAEQKNGAPPPEGQPPSETGDSKKKNKGETL